MDRAEWAYVVRLRLWVYFPAWVDNYCRARLLFASSNIPARHGRGLSGQRSQCEGWILFVTIGNKYGCVFYAFCRVESLVAPHADALPDFVLLSCARGHIFA